MTKILKNSQMVAMRQHLQPLLSHRDKVGYMAARNYRILSDSLTEYDAFQRSLIKKYGDPDKDEQGADLGTISLKIGSSKFKLFCDEMAPFNDMEHEVELMTGKYEDAIGCLTGEEILGVDWMFED